MDNRQITPEMRDAARKELARRELARRQSQVDQSQSDLSPLQQAGNIAQRYINDPIQNIMGQANDISAGAEQGVSNIAPGLANLGIHAYNGLTGNDVQPFKGFHFAPENLNATAGEIGSYFVPGLASAKIPEFASLASKSGKAIEDLLANSSLTKKLEPVKKFIENDDILSKIMSGLKSDATKNIGKGAFQGAVYSPENQTLGATVGALFGTTPYYKGSSLSEEVKNYLSTGEDVNKFIRSLTSGNTLTENLSELEKRIHFAAQSEKAQSLIPKNELMNDYYKSNVKELRSRDLPNIAAIAKIFSSDKQELTPERVLALKDAVRSFYKHGDVDRLINQGEDIFDIPDNNKLYKTLDTHLPLGEINYGNYGKIKDVDQHYHDEGVQRQHDAYMKKSSLYNADQLQSKLFKEIQPLKERFDAKTIDTYGENKLKDLKRNRKALLDDIQDKINTLPIKYQNLYKDFRSKYSNYARKYLSNGSDIRDISEGNPGGIKDSIIKNKFTGNLTPEVQGIVSDIGPSGKGNILANELLRSNPGDAIDLQDRLEKAIRLKGYGQYVSPETKKIVDNLAFRAKLNPANYHKQIIRLFSKIKGI